MIDPAIGKQAEVDPGSGLQKVNFESLKVEQRTAISGMTPEQRAVLHLWGVQMTSSGKQDGSVYLNVSANTDGNGKTKKFTEAEKKLVDELSRREMQKYGSITGKALDAEFFQLFEKLSGQAIADRYARATLNYSGGKPVNVGERDVADANGKFNDGLSAFENGILRLWGHQPLFSGGKLDGSIVSLTLVFPKALDFGLNKSDLQTLIAADKLASGTVDGSSLNQAFIGVMDRIYLAGPAVTPETVLAAARERAASADSGGYSKKGAFADLPLLRSPSDPFEIHSYIKAYVASGLVTGRANLYQVDAMAGSRFRQANDHELWTCALARCYAYQFVAVAARTNGDEKADPATVAGLLYGASLFPKLSKEAQLFAQVAAIYKGRFRGGPADYDNPKLKQLLLAKSRQLGDPSLAWLASGLDVGSADVPTIGATLNAIDSGKLHLAEVIACGSIPAEQMARYNEIIRLVKTGGYNQILTNYDSLPVKDLRGRPVRTESVALVSK